MNKIDSIIRTKSYTALTADEKELLVDLVDNEQEFNQIKRIYQLTAKQKQVSEIQPKQETKESLDAVFQKKHAFPAHDWHKNEPKTIPFYQKDWLKYAAVIAISVSLSTYFLLQSTQQVQQLAQTNTVKKSTSNLGKKNIPIKQSTSDTSNKKETDVASTPLLAQLDPINEQSRDSEKQIEASAFVEQASQKKNDATKDNVASFTTIQPTNWKNDSRMTMNSDDALDKETTVKIIANKTTTSVLSLINFAVPAF
ncbi:MAG: hypothetical protein KA734_09970 [Fluviicola sp.]|nr:hypothetical protein [Fluviicola sp.]